MDTITQTTATDSRCTADSGRRPVQNRRRSAQKRRAAMTFDAESVSGGTMRRGRTLWLVDIENILGAGSATREEIRRTWMTFTRHMDIPADDLVIIGCAHHLGITAIFEVDPQVRFVFRSGPNGGENALMDHVDPVWAARRFNWVVIASGDHAFTPWVLRARSLGMRSWQVTGRGLPSAQLAAACDLHTHLRLDTWGTAGSPSPLHVAATDPQEQALPRFTPENSSEATVRSQKVRPVPGRTDTATRSTRSVRYSRKRSGGHTRVWARHASASPTPAHRSDPALAPEK